MTKKDAILLFAQVAGGALLPVGVASSVTGLVKALTESPDIEQDDAQLAKLKVDYQTRIDRREHPEA